MMGMKTVFAALLALSAAACANHQGGAGAKAEVYGEIKAGLESSAGHAGK